MENLIQPCSHSAAAFIALSNRLPIMVVIEKSSILIPGVLILISHLIFCKRQTMRQSLKSTPPIIGDVASCIRPEDYLTMA